MALLAGLLPRAGVVLLTFGLVGLSEVRWAGYGAGGVLGRPRWSRSCSGP